MAGARSLIDVLLMANNRSLLFFIFSVFFLLLASHFLPIPFMADDFERLYAGETHNLSAFLEQYYLRFIFQGLGSEYLFELFKINFQMATFFFWMLSYGAYLLYAKTFFTETTKEQNNLFYLAPLVSVFGLNNYEWLLFPTVMTLYSVFFVMSFIFYLSHKKTIIPFHYRLFNLLGLVMGLLAYESLVPMAMMIEITYWWTRPLPFKRKLKEIVIFMGSSLLTIVLVKFFIHQNLTANIPSISNSYVFGFNNDQFWQMISMSFFHDYYKVRYLTGGLYFLSLLFMICCHKKETIKKHAPLILLYILSCSYYYFLLTYSSRRALGGPLLFIFPYLFYGLVFSYQRKNLLSKVAVILFFSSFLAHHASIFREKNHEFYGEKKFIEKVVQEKIAKPQLEDLKTMLPKRGWHVVNPIQLYGLLYYSIPANERTFLMDLKSNYPHVNHVYPIK